MRICSIAGSSERDKYCRCTQTPLLAVFDLKPLLLVGSSQERNIK